MISAYFFSTGILDLVWKYYLYKVCPDSNQFNDFLNQTTGYIGIISTLLALFVTGNLIRKFNWTVIALITPVLLLIPLTVLFVNGLIGETNPLYYKIGSIAGACYYCMNRICKYTFFDPSKEIACVEFSYSEQIKAKTVLDGIVPKMAKITEATVLQFMLILFSSFGSLIPSILVILLAAHLVWMLTIPIWSKRLFVKEPTN
jgi:AAA family ATP:ADP antiporter